MIFSVYVDLLLSICLFFYISKHYAIVTERVISLTLSNIQQICSRPLWKRLSKSTANPFKWKNNNWIELKSCRKKEKLLVLSNFFFCRHVFKKPSASKASESVYMREMFDFLRCCDINAILFFQLALIQTNQIIDTLKEMKPNHDFEIGISRF